MHDYCWNGGKRSFRKKDAQETLNFLKRNKHTRYRKELTIYQCPYCNFWHLTHHEQYEKTR